MLVLHQIQKIEGQEYLLLPLPVNNSGKDHVDAGKQGLGAIQVVCLVSLGRPAQMKSKLLLSAAVRQMQVVSIWCYKAYLRIFSLLV